MTTELDKHEADKFRDEGCTVLTSGWPDLLVVSPDGKPYGVELKRMGDVWHDEQPEMARVFADILGVPYILARSAEGVLNIGLTNIPRDFQPFTCAGKTASIELDHRLVKVPTS